MVKQSQSFWAPPDFQDADTAREARLLYVIARPMVVIVALLCAALLVPNLVEVPAISAATTAAMVGMLLFCMWLVQRGQVMVASAIIIGAYYINSFSAVVMFGGMRGALVIGLPGIILLAGALRGWSGALRSGIATGVGITAVSIMEVYGIVPVVLEELTVAGSWVSVVASLGIDLIFLALLVRNRREALESAEASQRQLASIIEGSPDGILVIEEDGTILSSNAAVAAFSGYAAKDIIGRKFADLPTIPDEEVRAALLQGLQGTLDGHERIEEFQLTSRDGTPLHVETHSSRLDMPDGSRQVQVVIRDTTERHRMAAARHQMEERASEAQRLESLGRLAGGVAHDFRNLLTVVQLSGELAKHKLGSSDIDKELDDIAQATQRASGMTKQLLAFARQSIERSEVLDVTAVLNDVLDLVKRLLPESISLHWKRPTETARVKADRSQLEQIVMNLVMNARDAIEQNGRIDVSVETRDLDQESAEFIGLSEASYLVLTVSDDGRGMDEYTRQRIYDPFFSTKGPGQGSGLGLATVHGVVTQSGGAMTVESEPGAGAKFEVYLPVTTSSATTASSEPRQWVGDNTAARRVLLVDDDHLVREAMKRSLQMHGHDVIDAPDGPAALALLASGTAPPDVLVSDMVMPQMSGLEFAEKVRQQHAELPVILISGYNEQFERGTVPELEQAVLLNKPFSVAELMRQIDEIVPDSTR